jgi:hypothetical protein
MSEEKDEPAEPAKEAEAEQSKLTHEQLIAKLRANPRFNVITPSGEGLIFTADRSR